MLARCNYCNCQLSKVSICLRYFESKVIITFLYNFNIY